MEGDPIPESFLASLVIPLRKKGDSSNPMDYRPISLLPTSYKIFAKILATRLQTFLGAMIDESQQGFVRSRLMERSVTLMQAITNLAYCDTRQAIDDAPAILLLDFMEAYDTLDRNFMLITLKKFEFSNRFVDLIEMMHRGTTAQFMVNGELSDRWNVHSRIRCTSSAPLDVEHDEWPGHGILPTSSAHYIRQGCPLAPLLFIIAAEILALAINQSPKLKGVSLPGSSFSPNKFAAFVDDSAVFLRHGKEIEPLVEVLETFGDLSGLRVQPQKSVYIPMNTANQQKAVSGVPVLLPGTTARYLGVHIGTGETEQINWEDRIAKIKARLLIATKITNSVVGKIAILNTIMLPAILFTATYVKAPEEIVQRLVNIQKQFLWRHSLSADGSRHKINPALLFTPIRAGELGLYSTPVALKRLAMKRATEWLMATESRYTEAWHHLAHPERIQTPKCCWITPEQWTSRERNRRLRSHSVQQQAIALLCEDVAEVENRPKEWKDEARDEMVRVHQDSEVVWENDGSVRLTIEDIWKPTQHQLSSEIQRFWPTYSWTHNPWIVNHKGEVYRDKDLPFIEDSNLARLNIERLTEVEYLFKIPSNVTRWNKVKKRKVKLWIISIIICSPPLEIGEGMWLSRKQTLRNECELQLQCTWTSNGLGTILGVPGGPLGVANYIELEHEAPGYHWRITEWSKNTQVMQDVTTLQQLEQKRGTTFEPHPLSTKFVSQVPTGTTPKGVARRLDKDRRKRSLFHIRQNLEAPVTRMETQAAKDEWTNAIVQRNQSEIWSAQDSITQYQMWVTYRLATYQLNLYYPGRQANNECKTDGACSRQRETIEHTMWHCLKAKNI